jgi:hypothetical protein
VLVLGLITIWFQNRGIGEEEIVMGSIPRRLTNAGLAIWWYAKQVFAPVRLMAVYPRWRFDSPTPLEWLPLIAVMAVIVLLWFWRTPVGRAVFFAFVYFIVALLPVLGFVRVAYMRSGTLVADHSQYFADISLIALFCAGMAWLWNSQRRSIRITTEVVVLLLLGAMGSYTRARANVFGARKHSGG